MFVVDNINAFNNKALNLKNNCHFYHDLKPLERFSDAIQTQLHEALPDDWWVVITDVIGSTKAIETGNYKKVNTVGVACIAAVTNVNRNIEIPFVFGGDGATFAVPNKLIEQLIPALRGAQKLSSESFDLDLRIGLVSVGTLTKKNLWVNVAKVRLSPLLNNATFSGRGWEEAERLVKTQDEINVLRVHYEDGVAEANFEGFECRWQGVPSFNGHKLSLLVSAMTNDANANLKIYQEVYEKINEIYGTVANYHPLRPSKMQLTLNPQLLSHELRVRSSQENRWKKLKYFAKMLFQNLAGKYLFAHHIDTEAVKWSRYRDELVENTDFRKFDGILRMVIDGNDAQTAELEAFLAAKHHARLLVYGMHKSREALVTCLVQSYTGNHLHFVDGSDGGYAMAARGLKQQLMLFKKNNNQPTY